MLIGNETIGVIKLENIEAVKPNYVIYKDKKDLIEQIVPLISLAIDCYRRRTAPRDVFFRVTAKKPLGFESVELGHVLIEHVLTSVCKSDYEYYAHNKNPEKLKERLPLVLGHETVGMVRETGYKQKYHSINRNKEGEPIHVGDRVVVIPQIPCGKCPTCQLSDGTVDSYGENYCENVKHMASNSDGSLQTHYRYWPQLLIRIPQGLSNRLAVLTEPVSQLVQVWRELGFAQGRTGFDLPMPNRKLSRELNEIQLANAFNIPPQKFNDYFEIFATSSQTPRAVLRLPWSEVADDQTMEMPFSHYALMRRGLFLTALQKNTTSVKKRAPKILVLGTGPLAYIAVVLLRNAYGVSKERVYVYGRRVQSVARFKRLAKVINVSQPEVDGRCIGYEPQPDIPENELRQQAISEYLNGAGIKFDIILDCVGGTATESLINLALDNIAHQGVIALFGLSDKPITVDFAKVLRNEITFKGFFRACRGSYEEALSYLQNDEFGKQIEYLLEEKTIIVNDELKLEQAFDKSVSKDFWGKVLVQLSRE